MSGSSLQHTGSFVAVRGLLSSSGTRALECAGLVAPRHVESYLVPRQGIELPVSFLMLCPHCKLANGPRGKSSDM